MYKADTLASNDRFFDPVYRFTLNEAAKQVKTAAALLHAEGMADSVSVAGQHILSGSCGGF